MSHYSQDIALRCLGFQLCAVHTHVRGLLAVSSLHITGRHLCGFHHSQALPNNRLPLEPPCHQPQVQLSWWRPQVDRLLCALMVATPGGQAPLCWASHSYTLLLKRARHLKGKNSF